LNESTWFGRLREFSSSAVVNLSEVVLFSEIFVILVEVRMVLLRVIWTDGRGISIIRISLLVNISFD